MHGDVSRFVDRLLDALRLRGAKEFERAPVRSADERAIRARDGETPGRRSSVAT